MATQIKAPVFQSQLRTVRSQLGANNQVKQFHVDEVICDIETDKVVLEVVTPADGHISAIYHQR